VTETTPAGPKPDISEASDITAALDEQQWFEPAPAFQVRDELQDLIARDLLGPWDGELEVLPDKSSGPGDRYLVGRLGPKRSTNTDTMDTDNAAGGDGADPELPDVLTVQNAGRMWASSMGLSCVVAEGTDTLDVTVEWGRYAKSDVLDDAGNLKRRWSRDQFRRELPVSLTDRSQCRGPPPRERPRRGTRPGERTG
jgi:hypothetical protein